MPKPPDQPPRQFTVTSPRRPLPFKLVLSKKDGAGTDVPGLAGPLWAMSQPLRKDFVPAVFEEAKPPATPTDDADLSTLAPSDDSKTDVAAGTSEEREVPDQFAEDQFIDDASSSSTQSRPSSPPKVERKVWTPEPELELKLTAAMRQFTSAKTHAARLAAVSRILRLLPREALESLAETRDPHERRPCRVALEYLGEEDVSWVKARSMLRDHGCQLVKDILALQGDCYVTWKKLSRLQEFGSLDSDTLRGRSIAALALALYLEVSCQAAQERLAASSSAPQFREDRPTYPCRVDISDIFEAILEAVRWGKTPLLLCRGHATKVGSILQDRSECVTIEVSSLLSTDTGWSRAVVEARQELHNQLIRALTEGRPLHIAVGTDVIPFNTTFCQDAIFPRAVFNNKHFMYLQSDAQRLLLPGDDYDALPCTTPSRARPDTYSVITTEFSRDEVSRRLGESLPHLGDMALIEVDCWR